MTGYELRDEADVRRYLVQGLCLQRVRGASAPAVERALQWALEIAAEGDPLPPVGFVADAGHLICGDAEGHVAHEGRSIPAELAAAIRAYEDYVLGKLYADSTFERAGDAVRRYRGRDRARGVRFVVGRFRERAGFGGIVVNPATIRSLLQASAEQIVGAGRQSLAEEGPLPLLVDLYDGLTRSARNVGEALGVEDVFELEHGTALAEFGQRVALRQLLRAAAALEEGLPSRPPKVKARRHEVATRILDEDSYPVGGFTSISNRGSTESLLHSQLAYMETDPDERPDLFDVKFLRDELLYYARDENRFLRRRHSFVFALDPDLAEARVKDAGVPWQRMIVLLAALVAAVRRAILWLSHESLRFEFLFLEQPGAAVLYDEEELVRIVLREQIANGTVAVGRLAAPALDAHCTSLTRRSTCHCVLASMKDHHPALTDALTTRLRVSRPKPRVSFGDEPPEAIPAESPLDAWRGALALLVRDFVTA